MTENPETPIVPPPLPEAGLQFDKAEYAQLPTSLSCGSCQQAIVSEYYDLAGTTICRDCRERIVGARGSRMRRVVRSLGAGFVAAAAGSAVYLFILWMFEIELGLIAIAIGFAVGSAVRWGGYGRGGPRYQALAIALTYLAIVSAYVPAIVSGFVKSQSETNERAVASSSSAVPATKQDMDLAEGFTSFVMLSAYVMTFAIVLPFLAGFENIIGIIIIGIGLYEAWKINKRPLITGPHAVGVSAGNLLTP